MVVWITASAVSILSVLLVLAAWKNDRTIDADKDVTVAEVLSAGRLRSAVSFKTPDGVTHTPRLGVLYPTNLTAGQRIDVEYSKADPDLVRVKGRDARVAVIPVASVIVVVWALAIPTLIVVGRMRRESEAFA
nr:DUF3592 domain-containing protein [Antrihabitans stalactiti]